MHAHGSNSQQAGDLSAVQPRNAIRASSWDDYSNRLRLIWTELVTLNTSVYVLEHIINFPDDVIAKGKGLFLTHVAALLFERSLLAVTKLATDKGQGPLTLPHFRDVVSSQYLREELRGRFHEALARCGFNRQTRSILKKVKEIRNKFVAHLSAEAILHARPDAFPKVSFEELRGLCSSLNGLFKLLCFGDDLRLLPVDYDPEAQRLNPDGPRPDVEHFLDLILRDSFFVSMPERLPSRAWEARRRAMSQERVDRLNALRRRCRLPEV